MSRELVNTRSNYTLLPDSVQTHVVMIRCIFDRPVFVQMMKPLTLALLFRLANLDESCRYAEVQNAHLSDKIFTDLLSVAKAFAWAVQNVEWFDA